MSTELTILIVLFYLVLILGLGYYGYRRTKKVEDYMVAGRNTPPMVIALSYGATFISTSAIVGFGGTAAQYGMSLMWLLRQRLAYMNGSVRVCGGCCAVCGYRRSDCGDVYGCGAGCDYAYGDRYSAGSDVCVSAALLRRTVLLRR